MTILWLFGVMKSMGSGDWWWCRKSIAGKQWKQLGKCNQDLVDVFPDMLNCGASLLLALLSTCSSLRWYSRCFVLLGTPFSRVSWMFASLKFKTKMVKWIIANFMIFCFCLGSMFSLHVFFFCARVSKNSMVCKSTWRPGKPRHSFWPSNQSANRPPRNRGLIDRFFFPHVPLPKWTNVALKRDHFT